MASLRMPPVFYVRNDRARQDIALSRQNCKLAARTSPPDGGTTVTSEKAVDGVIFVVEQARTKEKTLAFVTMWIEKT